MTSFLRLIALGMMIAFVLLQPALLKGAEWSFTPLVTVESFMNDNYQLTSGPHQTDWGALFLPEGSFTMENENWNITGKGHGSFYRLFTDTALDTDEHDLALAVALNLSEMETVHFSEVSQVDSTLGSELNQTGLFLVWTERNLNSISAENETRVNERVNLNNQYSYTRVTYAGNYTGLNNYTTHSLSSSLLDDWNERMKLIMTLYFSYNQTEGFETIARDIGISAGPKYRFSETVKGSLSAGGHTTETVVSLFGTTLENRATGWTLDGQVEKDFQPGHAVLELARDIQMSGMESMVQVDRATASYDHPLSERLSLSLNAAVSRSQPFANSVFFPKSDYYRYDGKITWQALEEVDLALEYSYMRVDTEGSLLSSVANSAFFLATWHPFKKSISR